MDRNNIKEDVTDVSSNQSLTSVNPFSDGRRFT